MFNFFFYSKIFYLIIPGKLLNMEATLNSKNEALYCFQTAKDLLNLNCDSFSDNYKIVLDRLT